MHELSITESILDIALSHAKKAEATQVTAINIRIGRLSSIVDDSVQFYWDIISKDTIAAGARLNFERVPARMACLDCGNNYLLTGDLIPCPQCNSERVTVAGGDEFRLDSIEINR